MKYYLKQLFCIHDFHYYVFEKQLRSGSYLLKYRFIKNNKRYFALQIYQVMRQCIKCNKQKIYTEYWGDDNSQNIAKTISNKLNKLKEFKNNQSN